jgi:diaminopimelate epimerase
MNRTLEFTKMQGTGNDFVMVDARSLDMDWQALSVKVCRYHFGIGADGLILIMTSPQADLKMRIFNADGSEAQICGNGLRCFAKYAIDRRIVPGPVISVDTMAGIKQIETTSRNGKVVSARVNMGRPHLKAAEIPIALVLKEPVLDQTLKVGGRTLSVSAASMGNPHAVCFIEEKVEDFPLDEIGPLVEHHKLFPQRTNFEVVNIAGEGKLRVRVWERGVGETLACGSGACATAVISRLKNISKDNVDIMLPGGTLTITWDGKSDVFLKGPAEEVFTGVYQL